MTGYHLGIKTQRASNLPDWQLAPWTNPVITSKLPVECGCTFVWHNGQFVLKFRNERCEEHRRVEQNRTARNRPYLRTLARGKRNITTLVTHHRR